MGQAAEQFATYVICIQQHKFASALRAHTSSALARQSVSRFWGVRQIVASKGRAGDG